MRAALTPDVPPPSTTTLPGNTPGTPPSSTPVPPWCLLSRLPPTNTDILPAISLIGSSNGSRWFTSMVSYAMHVAWLAASASVKPRLAARCR